MSEAAAQNRFAPPRAHVEDAFVSDVEMVLATRTSRLLAVLIDVSPGLVVGVIGGVAAAIMVPGLLKGGFVPRGSAMAGMGLGFAVFGILALAWTIWNIVLVYRYGQTVGKKAMGIRVVRTDGSRASFPRIVFLRVLGIAVIGSVIGAIGGALHFRFAGNIVTVLDYLAIFRASRLCLHDNIADTRVVLAAGSEMATLAGSSGEHLRTISF